MRMEEDVPNDPIKNQNAALTFRCQSILNQIF